jgi:colanic acid/amylovoran biosynthesis protein
MAVALPAARPAALDPAVARWLDPGRGFPLAGINVSGLLCNDAARARRDFGLADAHPAQIEAMARTLLTVEPELRLLIVPHVHRPEGDAESDLGAARACSSRASAISRGTASPSSAAVRTRWS